MNKPSKTFFTTKKAEDGTLEFYATDINGRPVGFPMTEKEAFKTEAVINKLLGDKTYDNR